MKQPNDLDEIAITELVLYALNTHEFYKRTQQLRINFATKIYKGIFSKELAIDFIADTWIPLAQQLYKKEFDLISLSKLERKEVAAQILDHWTDEIYEIADDIKSGLRTKRGAIKPLNKAPETTKELYR